MNKDVMFSSGKDTWETPDSLFKLYDDEFHFVLDAAANEVNHKCENWLGPNGIHEDALSVSWKPWLSIGNVWLNPPYSRKLQIEFIKKAFIETYGKGLGCVVTLLPARTDTKLFHQYIWDNEQDSPSQRENVELIFLKGRLKFKGAKHGAPFPSMIVIFN